MGVTPLERPAAAPQPLKHRSAQGRGRLPRIVARVEAMRSISALFARVLPAAARRFCGRVGEFFEGPSTRWRKLLENRVQILPKQSRAGVGSGLRGIAAANLSYIRTV